MHANNNFAFSIAAFNVGNWDIRDRPRFFDQVGHQTTNGSNENKHFFTK